MRADGRIDGQTDIMKLIVTFLNFANAPKNRQLNSIVSQKSNDRWRQAISSPSHFTSQEKNYLIYILIQFS